MKLKLNKIYKKKTIPIVKICVRFFQIVLNNIKKTNKKIICLINLFNFNLL